MSDDDELALLQEQLTEARAEVERLQMAAADSEARALHLKDGSGRARPARERRSRASLGARTRRRADGPDSTAFRRSWARDKRRRRSFMPASWQPPGSTARCSWRLPLSCRRSWSRATR